MRLLYQLQQVDSGLDELEDMKGDLPQAVNSLREELATFTQSLEEKQQVVIDSIKAREKADLDIHDFTDKLEKYKTQQYEVRSNKEYDAITKEIDFAQQSILELEKQFLAYEGTMSSAKAEIEELNVRIEDVRKVLEEKEAELDAVSKENEEEELKLKHAREKIIVRLKKETIARYDRIRAARDGKAVVSVRKNSCGGCHNRIPPQRLNELRNTTKMFTCEHCGRIIVPLEIAESAA
jgi:predicted  nucleic acid-binding Zn-ribbon protein